MKAMQSAKLILLETAGHICNFFKKLQRNIKRQEKGQKEYIYIYMKRLMKNQSIAMYEIYFNLESNKL